MGPQMGLFHVSHIPSADLAEIRHGRLIGLHFIVFVLNDLNKLQRTSFVILCLLRNT
jgi:hypothetical protein